jgi:hypothetical protein
MNLMRALIVGLCLVAVAACSEKRPVGPGPVSRQVVLAPGQTVTIQEAAIALRFEGVSGDSRCPADAMCVWGGDALVEIEVIPAPGQRHPYVLHTGDMRPIVHEDLTIALVELSPYPFSARTIPQGDYRATLLVTR